MIFMPVLLSGADREASVSYGLEMLAGPIFQVLVP